MLGTNLSTYQTASNGKRKEITTLKKLFYCTGGVRPRESKEKQALTARMGWW